MEERRVERHEVHEVERHEQPVPGREVTNVNVGPDGTTNVQEQSVVEEVGGERAEEVERRETIEERRVR